MSPTEFRDATTARLEPVAESVYMRLGARAANVIMIAVVIPIGISMWSRQMDAGDKSRDQADAQRVQIAQLTTSIVQLQAEIAERSKDRYTGTQAANDWNAQLRRDNAQDEDRRRLEGRIDKLEDWRASKKP